MGLAEYGRSVSGKLQTDMAGDPWGAYRPNVRPTFGWEIKQGQEIPPRGEGFERSEEKNSSGSREAHVEKRNLNHPY